ncbi:MAG: hypothetical protein NC489_22990 [Ruminococcus flavefaciens]|nr:hypothetical protein [Ruminococcus flavefaciens]
MLNFENIEDLVSYMFNNLDNEDSLVSVISNKEMTIEILHELLEYENVILNSCEIDYDDYYDKEYLVTLFDDIESDNWYINVEKCYLPDSNKYISIDGYVLFHENVNSKAMIDMQNNELMPLGEHDLFVVGEEVEGDNDADSEDTEELSDKSVTTSTSVYKINGKEVSKETFKSELDKVEEIYLDNMRDMLSGYAKFMDECNEWRKLFSGIYW